METATRVAAAAASGYILGRTKRLKLAIAVGSMLAGKRLATDPRGMMRQAGELVESRPELAKLSDQVRTTLFMAARGAAVGVVGQRIDRLSDSIRDRSDRLTGAVTDKVPLDRGSGDEDEERSDSRSDEDQDDRDEDQDESRGSRRPRRGDDGDDSGPEGGGTEEPGERSRPRKRAAKKTPAKRAVSERGDAPARKRTAKKSASSGRSRSGSRG
ncbi:hypothetical protein [Jiangella muralis]|uniref:hypothetical protein n=1 Tax=Jiangella muralis TaxID=702383 RepID=UPI00069D8382|nr:hypothetical protein [Jiangella muralis]